MGLSSINIANSMGSNGCVYVNHTNATQGEFSAVQFTTDSVVGAITGPMVNSAGFIADGTTFSQGQVIYMPITNLTLASGSCLLINK